MRTGSTLAFAAAALAAVAAVAGAAGADGAARSGATAAQAQTRPNVLVLMTDDQTLESMRVMANVQRLLVREGTSFANSYVSYPLCCPSRATFLTGQYGHNDNVMGNAPPQGGYGNLDHTNTLPVWLQRAGYRTVHLGKYLNGYGRDRSTPTTIPPGYSEWYGSVDPSTYRFYDYTLNENGRLLAYGTGAPNYQTDVYARKASELVRRLAPSDQPFYLKVAFLAPHAGGPQEQGDPRNQATPVPAPRHVNRFAAEPFPRPPSFNEADVSDKPASIRRRAVLRPARIAGIAENYRQRLESLLSVDEAVAEVIGALEATGELARTLIVFTSDNGFFHGEHRVPAGKVLAYEPSARVPLVLRGPGVPHGAVHQNPVLNVDLAATILDAANARAGRAPDGRSLLPLVQNPTRRWGRDLLLETTQYSAIRTPRWLYVEHGAGDRELYDLVADPNQLQSRHADPALASLRAALAQRLARLRACRGSACSSGPRVGLTASYTRGRSACARSAVGLRVGGGDIRGVTLVRFALGGRVLRADARAPFTATVARSRLGTRRTLLRATLVFADGREQTVDRLLRRCS
jgi:N-acetylglucosamine-6-sulfatase